MITGNRQMQYETDAAMLKEARKEYRKAKKEAQAAREARQKAAAAMPALTEQEKQEKILEIQAEINRRITPAARDNADDVTSDGVSRESAAEGVRARAEVLPQRQKIASSSAGARAPEARGGEREESAQRVKTKPNRRENEFMLNLMVLRNTLRTNAPACRDRARLAGKWIWRDIRLMLTLVDRIQGAMLQTMPESRDEYYSAYAKHGHYELHIDGPVKTARHLLVTDKHLGAICEAAMKSECIMCMREGSEIGRCELREALLETAAPTAIEDGDSLFRKCEYRDAAGALVQGNDVTI